MLKRQIIALKLLIINMNRNKLALQAHHMREAVLAFCWYGLLWLTFLRPNMRIYSYIK